MHQEQNEHVPVLLQPVLQYLNPQDGESYLDLTAGYGGHAGAVLECTHAPHEAVLVDRDTHAIAALRGFETQGALLVHGDFLSVSRRLAAEERRFDLVLADFGHIVTAH